MTLTTLWHFSSKFLYILPRHIHQLITPLPASICINIYTTLLIYLLFHSILFYRIAHWIKLQYVIFFARVEVCDCSALTPIPSGKQDDCPLCFFVIFVFCHLNNHALGHFPVWAMCGPIQNKISIACAAFQRKFSGEFVLSAAAAARRGDGGLGWSSKQGWCWGESSAQSQGSCPRPRQSALALALSPPPGRD